MQKQAPSLGRILTMVVFALSCFGLLLFLWLSFGGPTPLKPELYRFKVPFAEATTLAEEADVRIAGVTVGKVKTKELDKGATRTLVELELNDEYAPIPADTRAMLRQKTLLGETFVELTPGSASAPKLEEGGTLQVAQVEPSVELDEIFRIFDPKSKRGFRTWVRESARAIENGTGEDLNDAIGNLPGFARDGADVLRVLDEQEQAVQRLIKNTGVVFAALNEREGELRNLIVNANNLFEATAAEDDALAETFEVLPTFLDESRATLARLETFSRDTRPLVNDLKPVADDLGPTVRDLGRLAPDLENVFRDLDPLIAESRENLPQGSRFLRGARPVFKALHTFLPELNPVLSFANFQQQQLADFISIGTAALGGAVIEPTREQAPRQFLRQFGIINSRSFSFNQQRPEYERGNAYGAPNHLKRAIGFGIFESFDCKPTGGEKPQPTHPGSPPCFVQPKSLWDNNQFPRLLKPETPIRHAPQGREGNEPAVP